MTFQIRAEFVNIFNRTNVFQESNALYTIGSNVTGPGGIIVSKPLNFQPAFGTITQADSFNYRERQIQFGARFNF